MGTSKTNPDNPMKNASPTCPTHPKVVLTPTGIYAVQPEWRTRGLLPIGRCSECHAEAVARWPHGPAPATAPQLASPTATTATPA